MSSSIMDEGPSCSSSSSKRDNDDAALANEAKRRKLHGDAAGEAAEIFLRSFRRGPSGTTRPGAEYDAYAAREAEFRRNRRAKADKIQEEAERRKEEAERRKELLRKRHLRLFKEGDIYRIPDDDEMDGFVPMAEICQDVKVIVIGAGAAGLAATVELSKTFNVILLEATDDFGGRIKTINYGSSILELGAQWIHGELNNVTHDLAKSNDLINSEAPNYYKMLLAPTKTLPTEDQFIVDEILANLRSDFNYFIDNSAFKSNQLENTSLDQCIEKLFEKYVSDTDDDHVKKLKLAALDWFMRMECEIEGCQSLSSVSAKLLHKYTECEGDKAIELKNGYRRALELMVNLLPKDCIKYNKVVKFIDWSDRTTRQVTVYCNDGTLFNANHVIITMPLGYLKKHSEKLFFPKLPLKKRQAIKCTGFGTVNKIFLKFEDSFWKIGDIFKVIWTPDLEESCKNPDNANPWYKDINRFAYVINQPNVLSAWVSGEGACKMEELTDQQIKDDCYFLLVNLLKKELPKPSDMIRSSWNSERFIGGSYSYLSLLNATECCNSKDLEETVSWTSKDGERHPLLFFAGEATHSSFYSTVHGAMASGIREARKIYLHYANTRERLPLSIERLEKDDEEAERKLEAEREARREVEEDDDEEEEGEEEREEEGEEEREEEGEEEREEREELPE